VAHLNEERDSDDGRCELSAEEHVAVASQPAAHAWRDQFSMGGGSSDV